MVEKIKAFFGIKPTRFGGRGPGRRTIKDPATRIPVLIFVFEILDHITLASSDLRIRTYFCPAECCKRRPP